MLIVDPAPSSVSSGRGRGLPHVSPSVYATPGAETPAMLTNIIMDLVQEVKELKMANFRQPAAASDALIPSSVATASPGIQFQESDVQQHAGSASAKSEALTLDEIVDQRVREALARSGVQGSGNLFP